MSRNKTWIVLYLNDKHTTFDEADFDIYNLAEAPADRFARIALSSRVMFLLGMVGLDAEASLFNVFITAWRQSAKSEAKRPTM